MKKMIIRTILTIAFILSITACDNYLDITPPSDIPPEMYMTDESHLSAYMLSRYWVFDPPVGYAFSGDNGTDNQIGRNYNNLYTLTENKVPNGSTWDFKEIASINWFFDQVLPKWEKGDITGNPTMIKQYIGEAYFFRAWQYYSYLKKFGDFPIISSVLPTDKAILIEASKRKPRTDVAHFIISDIDKAIEYMSDIPGTKNRLWKGVALLFKSRVALYEGTWMKYFKDTPFVPNGTGWPGAASNPGYTFPEGSFDAEVKWFLEQAVEASDQLASGVSLTPNSKILPQSQGENNDYLMMFGALDMRGYNDILLWKAYNESLAVSNGIAQYAAGGNADLGLTKGMVDAFLMEDGLPIYAASGTKPYMGDNSISKLIENRDNRMFLFVKQPGQLNGYMNTSGENKGDQGHEIEPKPQFTSFTYGYSYPTGYACRKGWNPDMAQWFNIRSSCGYPVFRLVEAYLNYIEASYELHGTIDAKAKKYWEDIRNRGGVDPDYAKTITATDMSKEAKGDWGAYSSGTVLADKTLYNIRRERRVEMMLEGLRWDDLYRWRSLDQLKTTPYHVEGFKIWNSDMTAWYDDLNYTSSSSPNVTPPSESDYVRTLEIIKINNPIVSQGGLRWKLGHYLSAIGIDEFRKTSYQHSDYTDSPLYQNPYWGMIPNEPAAQ